MACAGTYIRFAVQIANTDVDYIYRPSRSDLWAALDAWELEAKARRLFEWKEPKKRIQVPTVPVIRRYDKMFTGRNFPIGGPKK